MFSSSQKSASDRFADFAPVWIPYLTGSSGPPVGDEEESKRHLLGGDLKFAHTLGDRWVPVGRKNIDWKGSHLDQQEWKAQLNRFFHLQHLCRFYLQTGDERFAAVAADQIADWIRANPISESYAPHACDNTLNLAIRCGSSRHPGWLATLPFFAESNAFSEELVASILESVHAQLRYLEGHLKPLNNWRIAQAEAFVLAGLCFPELQDAEHFLELGIGLLNEGVWRQFEEDGSHREHNPHYHTWMAAVYFHYWEVSQRRPDLGLQIPDHLVAAILQYTLFTKGPDGKKGALHDSQTLTTAGVIQQQVASFPDDAALERFVQATGLGEDFFAPQSRFFYNAGQFYLRPRDNSEMLSFDASRWGGSHCHLSRNAVEFYLGERRLLRDGGIYSYDGHEPFMAYGKGTRSHNTVNLNGWNQSVANPVATRAFQEGDRGIVTSEYEGGYWSGPMTWRFKEGTGESIWARHHRTLFWEAGRFALVIDSVNRDHATPGDAPSVECNWQLDAGSVIHEPENRRAFTADPGERNLLLQFLEFPEGAEILRFEGETAPLRGWLPGLGSIRPAPQISVTLPRMHSQDADFCTLMVPFEGTNPPRVKFRITRPDPIFVTVLEIEWEDGTRDELEWTCRLDYPLGARPDGTATAAFRHRKVSAGDSPANYFSAFSRRIVPPVSAT